MARVSVCTQVKNQSEFLRRMIKSVVDQTFTDWELIIVDDGSSEDIAQVVLSFDDHRIRVHHFTENKGVPHGFNWGFEHSTGDYLQPLSADEFIEPHKFEQQVAYLDNMPDIGCVWGMPGKGPMGERPLAEQYMMHAANRSRESWIKTLLTMDNIPIGGASMLMRRSCYEAIGGFDPDFFHCSDLEWFVRFFKKFQGKVLPFRWADADQPPDRLTAPSTENAARFQADVKRLAQTHRVVFPPIGDVTIGIPTYNMGWCLDQAIASCLRQTVDCKIMVLDDGSTDNTAEIVSKFPMVQFFKFDENRGLQEAHNQMVARCETEFYVTLAADDTLEPTFVERCLEQFKLNLFTELVASQTDFVDVKGVPIPPGTHHLHKIEPALNKTRAKWLERLYYGNVYFGAGMYRRSAIIDVGGWHKDDWVLCDYDMYLRLLHRENIVIVEAPLTHTRVHDGNYSTNIDGHRLQTTYSEIKKRYYQRKMRVVIATPYYEMKGWSPYIMSLVATTRMLTIMGIEWEYYELSGDSYVERAKNTLCARFLEDSMATDLFMIDSDMQWNPESFLKMLFVPEEIVVASYPQKNRWESWTSIPQWVKKPGEDESNKLYTIYKQLPDGSAIIKSAFLAGGFMRIKRTALEKFRDAYPEMSYKDSAADPSAPDRLYTEFFACERKDNLRWGEDRVFGSRMQGIGIEPWIYPNVDVSHFGVKGWSGNFDTYLRSLSNGNGEQRERPHPQSDAVATSTGGH
jgi:glycosyltransferase involved in cell wall biosynthesis